MLALGRRSIFQRPHNMRMHKLHRHLALERASLAGRRPRSRGLVLIASLNLQADRSARLVVDRSIDPRHAAPRRLGNNGEPPLKVHPAPRSLRRTRSARSKNLLQFAEHRRHSLRGLGRSDADTGRRIMLCLATDSNHTITHENPGLSLTPHLSIKIIHAAPTVILHDCNRI